MNLSFYKTSILECLDPWADEFINKYILIKYDHINILKTINRYINCDWYRDTINQKHLTNLKKQSNFELMPIQKINIPLDKNDNLILEELNNEPYEIYNQIHNFLENYLYFYDLLNQILNIQHLNIYFVL